MTALTVAILALAVIALVGNALIVHRLEYIEYVLNKLHEAFKVRRDDGR